MPHPGAPIRRRTSGATRAPRPLALLPLALVAACLVPRSSWGQATVTVSPTGAVRSIGEGVRRVTPGGTVVVLPGTYREPTIVVDKPLVLEGRGWPTVDGEGARELVLVKADDVTVRGLRLANTGVSHVDDRAAVRVAGARRCVVEDNRIDAAMFGVYLASVDGCRIARNVMRAVRGSEASSGNGVHLWSSRDVEIADNRIAGHRDGIYFEFVRDSRVLRNESSANSRYGLHFMYSDDCRYVGNRFARNGAGVAVMYTRNVEMTGNAFEDNWGAAAYGLLLKEIGDPVLVGNTFRRNTVALVSDGATRLVVRDNRFVDNGWAVRLQASTQDARFERNDFVGNTFDVATNARESAATFAGNYYDEYRGYDLDRDGVGDVPHRPVRLFSLVVAQNEPALILLRSFFVTLLDGAERVLPSLTPETVVDARPSMRQVHAARARAPGAGTLASSPGDVRILHAER